MADDHLHDEALSDALDGTTPPEVATHLEGCPRCRARLDAMATAVRAVAAPPPRPSDTARDAAVARALAEGGAPTGQRRAPVPAWMAAAAVVAVLLGIGGVVLAGRDGNRQPTALRDADEKATTAAGSASGVSAGGVIDGGDLGDQREAVALNTALQERLSAPTATNGGARTFAESAPEAPAADAAAPQCLTEAEAAGSGRVGQLVLTARLRWQGEAAVVLVFSATGQTELGRRAFVMARQDCRLLVVQSF